MKSTNNRYGTNQQIIFLAMFVQNHKKQFFNQVFFVSVDDFMTGEKKSDTLKFHLLCSAAKCRSQQ